MSSSSSGGSDSTASLKEGAMDVPTTSPSAAESSSIGAPEPVKMAPMTNGDHQSIRVNPYEESQIQMNGHHEDEMPEEDEPDSSKKHKEHEDSGVKETGKGGTENRMASVITINGTDATIHDSTVNSIGGGKARPEKIVGGGFDNAGFVDDEAHSKGKVVNGGGVSPPSSPPRPPSPAGPFLNSAVPMTPTHSSGGANGRGPVMETPNSNLHNNSGLIMTPSEKEKGDLDGSANVTEAVNLELVNMNPYGGAGLGVGEDVAGGKSGTNGGLNGIPVKRGVGDEETGDGGFGDPYDEYFVPVNEHRKYIRGEKLYVTKDRRRSQSWRRCICWGIGFTLLAVAILIAVLAGTGVILSQEPEGAVEGRGFSSSHPHVAESKDPKAPVEKGLPPSTSLPPEPSSSFTPPPSISSVPVTPPTTEMSGLYVPRVLEAEMRIDSLEYSPDLANSSSPEFQRLAADLEGELKMALFDHHTMTHGPADLFVKITSFLPGSVMSKFHVGWRFKDSFVPSSDPIDSDSLRDRLEAHLLNNGGYLYTYHISSGSVKAKHVMDLCQIDNGGCSHECRYDYEDAKFMCNCPPGLYLDQTEKKCTTELIEDTMTVSSTEGPKFGEGPWIPMEPEEHVFTAEVAKPSENSHESEDDEAHEHMDHHSMHEDHFHTVHTMDQDEPAESSKDDEQDIHESMGGRDHEIHVVEPDEESHEDHSEEPESDEVHHKDHEVFSSVGRGMSSEDDMAGAFHPSEKEIGSDESHESHETHDVKDHVEEEKITTSEGLPQPNEDMDKFSHSVDSSENTSEEEHDSGEMEDSHKKADNAEKEGESSMSEGEKSDGSSSNELHSHIPLTHPETTSSETSTERSKESVDYHDHLLHHIETDVNTALNETGHENNDGPLKGDIISAVEHVIVKDEDKTVTGSEGEDVMTGINHEIESSSASHEPVDESDHSMDEMVAHVAMEGEHESPSGNMEDTSEPVDKQEEEMSAHVKEQANSGDHENEHSGMGVGEVGVTVVGSEETQGSSEEKIKFESEMEEKEVVKNEDMGVNSPDGSAQSMPEDKETSVMEEHDPTTVTGQDINYVINHEDSHKSSENSDNSLNPVEGDGGANEGSSVDVNNVTEVTFGEDEHKTDFTSMNHEKPENEEEIKKQMGSNDGLEHDVGAPVTVLVEGTGENKDDVGMEETPAAVIENETDINSDKSTVKESFEEETAEKDQGKDSNTEDLSQESVHSIDGAVAEDMQKNNPENESEGGETVDSMKDGEEETHVLDDSVKENDSTDDNDKMDAIATVKPSDEESATLPTEEEASEAMNEAMDGSKSDKQDTDGQTIASRPDEELGKNDVLVETPVSEKEVISEYDDPNIVPVEETPKETIDITDGKKMPFYPDLDVRIDGGSEAEKTESIEETTMKQGHAETPVIDFMSPVVPLTESDNDENASGKADGHEMIASSSTSSPSENSIENLSDHYNSTDTINHISATAENDLSAIPGPFVIPVITNNESTTAITTPSPKENNIDDPPLHLQAGIPLMVSEVPSSTEPATITTKQAAENDLSSLDNGGEPSEGKNTKKDEITVKNIAELDNLEKIIDETAAKLEAEVDKDSPHDPESSSDSSVKMDSEKQMAEEDMKDAGEKPIAESVDTLVVGSESDEPVTKEDSISTVNQDFILDHANTVHATSPTSPSAIEEPSKEDNVSETPIMEPHDTHSLEGSVTKDAESEKPDPLIPFDDNERSNNLATLDNEGLVTLPEEGKDSLVKVGAVDLGLKSTTEHTNEIAIATLDHKNWPATALEVHNVTDGVSVSNTNEERNQMDAKEPKSKTDSFEIPMKKKVDFKKPIHHEDETFKPLFFKEGKESLNKVDKIGLLPASPAMREEPNMDVVSEEEVDGLPIATTEEPMEVEKSSVADEISPVESVTPILTLGDKGGERLNAISEDDSGKDTGKPVTKESVKETETGVTMKSETTKDGDSPLVEVSKEKDEQEMKVEDKMDEQNGMTEAVTDSLNIVSVEPEPKNHDEVEKLDERKGEIPEDTTKMDKSDEIPTTAEPMKEEVTTMSMESETVMPSIFSEERMNKGIDELDVGKVTEKTNSEEEGTTVMNVSVANTVATPIEVHKKMEEMLKEMGGFGEGGHKVVAKTGVETDVDVSSMESSTEKMDVSSTTSTMSTTMESSSTVDPPSSSQDSISITSMEQDPTTVPPVDEGVGMEEKKDEAISRENVPDDLQDAKNDTMSTSEDPVPTMMVHEIMTESPLSSSPATVEVSSEQSIASVVNENPEISSSTVPAEGDLTTVTPESMTEPEILVKEETSNAGGDGDVKEVKTTTTSEPPMESSSLESRANNDETEKNHIEGDEVVSNASMSEFPDLDQQFFSKCTAGQFQCTNGTSLTPHSVMPISSSSVTSVATGVACVPLSAKCDSINDCSDGSDELGCIEEGCPGNFQCSNGQCLKRHLVCNGIVDCNDGSDEASCDKWQCQFDEFQCPSGRCIPILWLCDGKPDCDNHTDEYNCQDSCGNDEYLCPERWCIPMSWRCNGVPECANGEDEKLCDCSLEQVKCGTGGCVARSEICDGVEQCPDQSDEWGCVQLHNETMKLEVRNSDNQWLPVCADRWDSNWSNFVCQSFGYSRSVFTEYPTSGDLDGTTDVFMLKPGASIVTPPGNGMRLPGVLQQASSSLCSSGSIVEISCQEYTCGNHGLADGVAARLVGGDEAANGQWPSVALLYHTRQRATCTASIISPRWLIASYNCLHMREKSLSPDGWVAFGGGSTFDKDKPETQIKNVRSIVPYPQVKYNRFLYNHDVALVELMEPLSFTRSVGAICLPDRPIEPRQLCVTAGWGYTSPGEINFSQYLHYLPVPTIDLKECNSSKHYSGFITEDKICAGFTDAMHSPCYNDEGAPLMCVSEGGIWELQGVLSYHSNCGRGYHPSIFSSVTAVRDWVKRVVGGRFERRSTFNVRRRRRTKRRRSLVIWT